VKIPTDRETGQARGFAFVTFSRCCMAAGVVLLHGGGAAAWRWCCCMAVVVVLVLFAVEIAKPAPPPSFADALAVLLKPPLPRRLRLPTARAAT
jgi:hypothetical protein